eukprot:4813422-Prymnesium_polylepis.2
MGLIGECSGVGKSLWGSSHELPLFSMSAASGSEGSSQESLLSGAVLLPVTPTASLRTSSGSGRIWRNAEMLMSVASSIP